jgi:hypothetical protein
VVVGHRQVLALIEQALVPRSMFVTLEPDRNAEL